MEDWDISTTRKEYPTTTPRFITKTRRNQEEKDQEDEFKTTIDEITGKSKRPK
jgi:hypothetical protein